MRTAIITLLILVFLTGTVWADRSLESAEISKILKVLTDQPRRTWIDSGTISATHEEYRAPRMTDADQINNRINKEIQKFQTKTAKTHAAARMQKKLDTIAFDTRYKLSNEYKMNSSVVVKYDGERFYWEINANSRTDSVKTSTEMPGEQFDPARNARRIFVWDGQEYSIYSRSGHRAIVDASGSIPRGVTGPLTAGLIPWGYGAYTYENLSACESSAVEKHVDGKAQVHLTLTRSDGLQMFFVLDAERNFAVISHFEEGANENSFKQYGHYQVVSGRLVPTAIAIERRDALTNKVLASDFWNFKSIKGCTPAITDFSIEYTTDDIIEYKSPVIDKAVVYRYSPMVDVQLLLAERLAFAASEGSRKQNCATASLKWVTAQLGRDVADDQFAQLVKGTNGVTSLRRMKAFAQRQGLHCRAVKTDLETLKRLDGCEAILHIPKKNHFVTLGDVDGEYVWSIDLAHARFCYRTDIGRFGADWSEGTALLISDSPITDELNDIDGGGLQMITGGTGFACTYLVQEEDVNYCDGSGGGCWGAYAYQPERWGCEEAPRGMCMDSWMLSYAECACILDPRYFDCDVDGNWSFYFTRACY